MSAFGLLRTARMFARVAGRLPPSHLWFLARRMADERPHKFGRQVRINSFFPPCPSPAFDRFCAAVVARSRVPYSTYFAVTARCDSGCAHCSYRGRAPGELSTAQALAVVRDVKALGGITLGFTGGEPLMRCDLEELVAAAGPELSTIVFTTGRGLDLGRAKRLSDAGLGCLTLGVEWSEPSRHDAVRGRPGSFAEARAAAESCRQAGLYLAISTVATREKLAAGELARMHALGAAWGAQELRVLSPTATGGWVGRCGEMLDDGERAALSRFHVEINRSGAGPVVACAAHLESDALFGCGAGYHHLFIDSAGEVCPCDLTPLSLGSATREPLAEIWARMETWFSRPRCGCLMTQVAPNIPAGPLPLPRAESEALLPPREPGQALPGAFQRLFKPETR